MASLPAKRAIVLLTDCLGELGGGAEKQIFELAKRLDKARYQVAVVSLDHCGQQTRALIESAGCRFEVFRVVRIYGSSGFVQGWRFFRFLRESRADVLMTYHFSSDVWGAIVGRLAGVKTIISNRRDMGFWRSGRHIGMYRAVNRWVKRVVFVASAVRDKMAGEENLPECQCRVIYNGVEQVTFPSQEKIWELKRSLGIHPGELIVLHVGNLRPVKGHEYLIRAFAGVAAGSPSSRLVLVGEDMMNGRVQALAAECGLKERVLFLGKRKDVQDLLHVADICVMPSLSEGMSNAILEYMAAGKPVIATRVGGNPELVEDGKTGLLVEKESAAQLQDAISRLWGDGELRSRMGQAGLEKVRTTFSMDTMVSRYEELFRTEG